MSLDVMLIVIEIVSLNCRITYVASRIKLSIGQAVGHRLVSYPIAYSILEYGDTLPVPCIYVQFDNLPEQCQSSDPLYANAFGLG